MTALATEPESVADIPQIYLASPLTGLSEKDQRLICSEVSSLKSAIEKATGTDRPAGDEWPVTVYAPVDHTAPWKGDGLSPSTIYERNLSEVLDSDALVVIGEDGLSAGVGQEIAWATAAGLPILCLTPGTVMSRQITGTPGRLTVAAFNNDIATRDLRLSGWLRTNRSLIEDGPRRRSDRRLRYAGVTARLQSAWKALGDPTGAAARCNMSPGSVDSVLRDPARVAMMPVEWLDALTTELNVPRPLAGPQLTIRAVRALLACVEQEGLDDGTADRLRMVGTARLGSDPKLDLETADNWRTLLTDLSG